MEKMEWSCNCLKQLVIMVFFHMMNHRGITIFRSSRLRLGMSLLEILIACIILAFSMIPIAAMIGAGFRGTARDNRQIKAIQLCQARLNQCQAVPFSSLVTTGVDITSGTVLLLDLGLQTIDNVPFTVDLQVADHPVNFTFQAVDINQPGYDRNTPTTWVFLNNQTLSIPANAARRVTIRVTWTENPNVPQQVVSMTTFRANFDY